MKPFDCLHYDREKRTGFTLIELIIALAVAAVLSLCMVSLFSLTLATEKSMENSEDTFLQARYALESIDKKSGNPIKYSRYRHIFYLTAMIICPFFSLKVIRIK